MGVDWTATELRQLRYRLGWSQAEMAWRLNLDTAMISAWEKGGGSPLDEHRSALLRILHLAESNAEKIQRRPLAEAMMRNRGLSQIHDLDVIDGLPAIEKADKSEV